MKKERNCNCGMAPYPIYPTYNPGMMMPNVNPAMAPGPVMNQATFNTPNQMDTNYMPGGNNIEQQIYNLNNQISSLEKRVTNLENLVGNNSTQYNTSNYQVM